MFQSYREIDEWRFKMHILWTLVEGLTQHLEGVASRKGILQALEELEERWGYLKILWEDHALYPDVTEEDLPSWDI